jgi:hypothetical protein
MPGNKTASRCWHFRMTCGEFEILIPGVKWCGTHAKKARRSQLLVLGKCAHNNSPLIAQWLPDIFQVSNNACAAMRVIGGADTVL